MYNYNPTLRLSLCENFQVFFFLILLKNFISGLDIEDFKERTYQKFGRGSAYDSDTVDAYKLKAGHSGQ